MREVFTKIRENYENLPKTKKKVADYFLGNFRSIPFMSITALADAIGVSDTTIINYCTDIGFSGFGAFKKAVSHYILQEEALIDERISADTGEDTVARAFSEQEQKNIADTFNNSQNIVQMNQAAELLCGARRIYCVGHRSSAGLASILNIFLLQMGRDSECLLSGSGEYLERAIQITPKDVAVVFTFKRYTKITMQILCYLHEKGVPCIIVTDINESPAKTYSDICISCCTKGVSRQFDSYVAALGVINYLIYSNVRHSQQKSEANLKKLNDLSYRFNTFSENYY